MSAGSSLKPLTPPQKPRSVFPLCNGGKPFRKARKHHKKRSRRLMKLNEAQTLPSSEVPTFEPPRSSRDIASTSQPKPSRDEQRRIKDAEKAAKRPKRPRHRYSTDDIEAAVEAIKSGSLSFRQAERQFGIPKTTLNWRVRNKHSGPIGPPYALSEVLEQELGNLIRLYCRKGNVLDSAFFCKLAKEHVQRTDPNANFLAHKDWLKGFLQRNDLKEFKDGVSKALGVHRIISCSDSIANSFCKELRTAYETMSDLSHQLSIRLLLFSRRKISGAESSQ